MDLQCIRENEDLKSKLLEEYQDKSKQMEQAHIKKCNNEKNDLENQKENQCD
jgi:hypothetical protein